MKHTVIILAFFLVAVVARAQQTMVVPWQPMTNQTAARANVYHPNPILFVHGINANDEDWGNDAIPALRDHFAVYDLPNAAQRLADPTDTNNLARYRSKQRNFLHTFNYGDPPPSGPLDFGDFNRHSYDHIRWNAWEESGSSDGITTTATKEGSCI
jgi:pimeloyl-ACP methyl ester carboxylesterase